MLSYRRYHFGAKPLVSLFHSVCNPFATPRTRGAFVFGLRLMAIDGTVEDAPDTPENVAAFGKPSTARGNAAFPQVKGVYLVECATHAVIDAGFWPCRVSERVGALCACCAPCSPICWSCGTVDCMISICWLAQEAMGLMCSPASLPTSNLKRCTAFVMAPIWPTSTLPNTNAERKASHARSDHRIHSDRSCLTREEHLQWPQSSIPFNQAVAVI